MKVSESPLDWTPKEQELSQALLMLQALRDPTRHDHSVALASLEEYVTNSNFVLVMLHTFSSGAQYENLGLTSDLRQLAGLIIKNYVFPHLGRLPVNVQSTLKREVVHILSDVNPEIRKTAAILAGKISESFPISTWSDMIPPILQMMDISLYESHPIAVEGSLQAIQRICEDSSMKLSLDEINRPLDSLIPKLLALVTCREASIRISALGSYNALLYLLNCRGSHDSLRSRNSSFDSNNSINNNNNNSNSIGINIGSTGSGSNYNSHNNSNADLRNSMGFPPSPSVSLTFSNVGNACHPLTVHMNAFLQCLAQLAADPQPAVRRAVCQAIATIASVHVAVLDPYFANICTFMLTALQDTEESVAIESCEYWSVMLEQVDTKRAILPYLQPLIEHLISRLYLTSEQMEQERIDEEEESSGEKELNLQPLHHRGSGGGSGSSTTTTNESRSSGGGIDNTSSSGSGNSSSSGRSAEAKENSELSSKWTLRKQCALLLDTVAISFPPMDILSFALPRIQEYFQHSSALVKESGMLALGALSTGCLDAMLPYIPQLFPFLLQNFQDPLPEMRSITCWVLSRYCGLFAEMGGSSDDEENSSNNPEGQRFYQLSLHALLATMFDDKPKVQVAACSALCLLVENSFYVRGSSNGSSNSISITSGGGGGKANEEEHNVLIEHLPAILTAISKAFPIYGIKSSLILVDTIGTIADTVREELKNPQYTALYFPQLMQKFAELEDNDMRMFPVMECLTSVLSVIGLEAQAYVHAIYQRCLTIVTDVLKAHAMAVQTQLQTGESYSEEDLPSKDFAICGFDVISALSEGLGPLFVTLVQEGGGGAGITAGGGNTQDLLMELMFAAISDLLPALRQSGFSLSGEICKHSFALITPAIANSLLPYAVRSLDTDFPLVCNNAAWTIGELALQVGGEYLQPYIARMMTSLITALQTAHMADHLKVNVAVTIARLAIVDTLEVAECADEYFADWCSVLSLPCPLNERIHAFHGLLSVLHKNPNVLLNNKTNIYSFLVACVSAWDAVHGPPPSDITTGIKEVILAVKASNEALWSRVMAKFGNSYSVAALVQLYQLSG